MSGVVVVVAGGDALDPSMGHRVPADAHVIAADSGVDRALAVGLAVHEAIGDLDSVTPAGLEAVEASGGEIERYPADKDATDLELALDRAIRRRPSSLLLLGGGGGRLDHLLANALVLARPDLGPFEPTALVGSATMTVVHPGRRRSLAGAPDEIVSLLPFHGSASGVTTSGLRWPLSDATLPPGTTRGVSNQFLSTAAAVGVTAGVLLVVQPGSVAEVPPTRPASNADPVGGSAPGRAR